MEIPGQISAEIDNLGRWRTSNRLRLHMERNAAFVGMLEINRNPPGKLAELSVRARITNSIAGDGDMRSGRVHPPIRGGCGGDVGLREDPKRQRRAD
jgi:hypothetical protein